MSHPPASSTPSRDRPILIGICFYAYGTGLTRVMRTTMAALADEFEIHYLGLGHKGPPIQENGYTVHPTNPTGGDVFATVQLRKMIDEMEPDAVFVLHDIWLFQNYQYAFQKAQYQNTAFIGYIPLDGNIIDEKLAEPLAQLDCIALYTDWAKEQVSQACQRIRQKSEPPAPEFSDIHVIPHGIDIAEFHPFPELIDADFHSAGRVTAKKHLFPDLTDPADSFIILNASCPSPRKRLPVTIDAFAKFAENKPDNVRLCLHQAITEDETRELLAYAEEKLGPRLIYNPQTSRTGGAISETELNLLYNACDIGVNTSSGEGWGLVSFEHAAAGAVQIIPDHSACSSLWNDQNAEMITPSSRGLPMYSPLEMAYVDTDAVAAAFEKLYADPELRQKKSRAAHQHAIRPEWHWSNVVKQWPPLIRDAIARKKTRQTV